MEQLTPFYDSTASDSYFKFSEHQQGLNDAELNRVMLALSASIDLRELIATYFQQLKNHVRIEGLSLNIDDEQFAIGTTGELEQARLLNCHAQDLIFAELYYHGANLLGLNDWLKLQNLHNCLLRPLRNAIEHRRVKRLATKDHLTTLDNRASFDETLQRLISQACRSGQGFALMVLDLDKFKPINDSYGHQQGDRVLMDFAAVLKSCLRDTDHAFRLGGDEFCCLLPDSDAAATAIVVERVRQAVAETRSLNRYDLSCSIGSAQFDKHDTPDSLFARADQHLYQHKAQL